MATTIQVGILGLGRLGASMGLALKRYNARKDARQQFVITGFASDNRQATGSREAVDHQARSLREAASDKDIVVLALPYREVQSAYQIIGQDVRSGAVLLDASPLKLPSQTWASKYLADEAHMVGVTPVLNPKYLFDGLDDTEHAADDLFDGGTLLLLPSPKCDPAAVELASDFGGLLGLTPLYGDPAEHDVWAAAVEGLPAALGLVAFYALNHADGWNDARKVGNASFGRLTHHLFDQHPDDLRDLMLNNRENMIRQIDATQEALRALRDVLAENNRPTLEAMLINTMDTYVTWLVHRREGKWDRSEKPVNVSKSDFFMSGMFGGYLTKRIKREKDDDE
jgi:prephenate dehydrogenase